MDDNYTARSIEADAPARATKDTNTPGSLFNEKNFWDAFFSDLSAATQSVAIVSPFATIKRSRVLVPRIEPLISRGVKVTVYTKPAEEHSQSYMIEDAAQVISLLDKMGVKLILQKEIHQKVAIIDDHICWEGSLNIFSHTGSTLGTHEAPSRQRHCGGNQKQSQTIGEHEEWPNCMKVNSELLRFIFMYAINFANTYRYG